MVWFIVGLFVGAGVGVGIVAFAVAVSEDEPDMHEDAKHNDHWRWEGWK